MTVTELKQHRIFDCEGLQSSEILERIPITYRQLDFWTRSGRLTCHYHSKGKIITDGKGGSGSTACWLPDQIKIIGRVLKLIECGFDLGRSFELATSHDAVLAVLNEIRYIDLDLVEDKRRKGVR